MRVKRVSKGGILGEERRKGYFFLLNFTKGAPMALQWQYRCVSPAKWAKRTTNVDHVIPIFLFLFFLLSFEFHHARCIQNFVDLFFPKESGERYYTSHPKEKILQERTQTLSGICKYNRFGEKGGDDVDARAVSFQQRGRHEFWVVSLSDRLASSYRQEFIGLVIALAPNKRGDRGAREGWKAMARCNWYRW